MRWRGKWLTPGYPGGVSRLRKHSQSSELALCHHQGLHTFLASFPGEGCYSRVPRSQWESVLCVTHPPSRITCSTFILCLPLSFASLFRSLQTLCAPSASHAHSCPLLLWSLLRTAPPSSDSTACSGRSQVYGRTCVAEKPL